MADRRPLLPWITILFLVLGVAAIASGVSILTYGARCHSPSCEQPTALAVAMLAWGVLALLTCIRGRVGLAALIEMIVAPLLISWVHFWSLLLWLVVMLGVVHSSKDQLALYYRWHKEPTR